MPNTKLDRVVTSLEKWVSDFETEKTKFVNKLDTNPIYAFEYSMTIMSLAARAEQARHFLDGIATRREAKDMSDDVMLTKISEVSMKNAIDVIRNPQHSSSPQSDYMYQEYGRTAAEIVDLIRFEY